MKRREKLVSAGYAAGWALTKAMPGPVAALAFRMGADRAYKRQGLGVRQLATNLRRVVGPERDEAELATLTRDAMRSYGRYWLETFRLPVMNQPEVARRVVVEGIEHFDTAYSQGHGVIFALPHMGNWDVAGVWLIHHATSFTTVVERLKPDSLYRRFVEYRESLGMEVLPVNGGEAPLADVLRTRLKEGGVVALVADRDLSAAGIPVTFFGEEAKMPAGPAVLAATTGAALLPCAIWFEGDDWRLRIHSRMLIPTDGRLRERVVATTQRLADIFAGDIAGHPADWHMLQPLWPADLRE